MMCLPNYARYLKMRKARIFAFKNSSLLVGLIFSLSASTHMLNSIAATQDKTLVYCFAARPTGFSANLVISIPAQTASSIPYNRLVEFERGGTMLEPGLAESWDISKDGKVYTFHLRRGVKFHTTPWFKPTREFNAEDVLFTFEWMRNPNMPFRKAYPVEFPYWSYTNFSKLIIK